MSSLVKNQIAKQLARFTKNFSPNKISVKFLKGEGELHNLELDEKIISDLLELPQWLRITKAVCNKISAKIHWTKLKTDPICLYLDCVEIDMEEVILSQTNSMSTIPSRPPPPQVKEKQANRYGFVEKVVDGMFVQMNSVIISFKSLQFQASVQISRLIIQSTTPEWNPDDLRNTRIKDEGRGEVLTFKEIHWSTLRIDANAIVPKNCSDKSSPIRLITSQSALHITIKKKLEDCSVASACLELLLDDILWVLTQSQLQALVNFMNSINKAMDQPGTKKEPVANGTAPGQTTQHQTPTQYTSSNLQNNPDPDNQGSDFSKYDLLETSYHLRTGRIDLHLCDDSDEKDKKNSADMLAGGAMQVNINKLAIDNYPYHLAGTSRTKWVCHNEASLTRAYWVNQLLNTFRNNVKSRKLPSSEGMETRPTRSKAEGSSSVDSPSHPPSSPSRHHAPPPPPPPPPPHTSTPSSPQQQRIAQTHSQRRPVFMYENCYLIRCEEFVIMPVTTYNAPKEGVPFLSSDKKALYLPTDMPAFQVDYTQYYYPTGINSPVPGPNLFVQLNPVQLTLDTTTCIWFNRFLRTIFSAGDPSRSLQTQQPSHVDIRIEGLMPKIILPCPSEPGCHYRESRPQALQVQMSQVALTNSRVGSNSSQTELLMLLQQFSLSKLYTDYNVFPNDFNDVRPLSNLAWLKDFGVVEDPVRIERLLNGLRNDSSSTCSPSQVWCFTAEQCWADFLGITSNKNRPMAFIEALPLRLWICTPIPHRTPEIIPPGPCRPDSGERRRIPQPSSTASSPGCLRSHPNSQPSTAIHISSSSPNLKDGAKKSMDHNRVNDINTTKCPPGSNSLPTSPKVRGIGHKHQSGINTGLREDNVVEGKPFIVASLSKSSHSLSSLSKEEFNGGVEPLQDSGNGAEVPDRLIPNGLSHNKTTYTNTENPKTSSGNANKGPKLLGHEPDGGSSRHNEEAPNLRKGFGSYSSTDEENLGDYPMDPPKVADMSVLAVIPANFAVQFDHFQYIFLIRLQESILKMQEQLDSEARRHLSEYGSPSDASSPTVTFSLLAKRGEVSIVLPPGPELSNSRGTSSASSYNDPGFVSDGDTGLPDVVTNDLDIRDKSPHPRPETVSPLPKEDHTLHSLNIQSKSPRGDLLPVIDGSIGADHTGRGSASPMCDSTNGWVLQDGDKGVNKTRRDSDASCCSSQLGTSVESSARSSARSLRSGRIVSIFSAEGSDLHLAVHVEGDDTTVKGTLQDLQIDEKGNHNFEKYLNQKSFKTPQENSTMVPHPLPTTAPMVCVRAEFGPGAERNTPSAGERGFAHALLDNVSLSLMMSNMESLSECFDDEILLPKMPFYVELKSSSICIRDDKPPRLLSIPPPLPINVNLENISIFRNQDGVIHIKALNPLAIRGTDNYPAEAEEPFRAEFDRAPSRLSRTASDLSLAESISSRSDNDSERECMKAQLSVSRAALHAVQDERQALLKTIERLQYELAVSNREQDRLQAKVIAYQGGTARRKTYN